MNSCCRGSPPPAPHVIEDALPSSRARSHRAAAELPKVSEFYALQQLPPVLPREFKVLLIDVRNRQEELFREVLEQQEELRCQMLGMRSDFKSFMGANIAKASNAQGTDVAVTPYDKIKTYLGRQSHATHILQQEEQAAGQEDTILKEPNIEQTPERSEHKSRQEDSDGQEASSNCVMSPIAHDRKTMDFMNVGRNSTSEMSDSRSGRFLVRASRILACKEFEVGIATTIMVNSFVMFWECQYQGLDVGFSLQYPGRSSESHDVWPGAQTMFDILDWVFGLLFLIEMVVKLACWRSSYFYEHVESKRYFHCSAGRYGERYLLLFGWVLQWIRGLQGWNILDFSCVAAFLFDKIPAVSSYINPQTIRVVRLVRLARLVRIFRFLKNLDHLYVMTTSICALSSVLAWAVFLLTLMLLTCDLLLVQTLHVVYFNNIKASNLTENELQKYHLMYEYFGTSTRCMLSMFEITLGNWPPIARLLSEEVSEWFTFICLVHKLTIGFSVVGVITGVILQQTFKVAQTDDVIIFRQKALATSIAKKKITALFGLLDKNGDNRIAVSEFESIRDMPELKIWLSSLGYETDDLNMLFSLVDVDGDGYITLDELVARMPRLAGPARSIDVLAIQQQHWKRDQRPSNSGKSSTRFCDFMFDDEWDDA